MKIINEKGKDFLKDFFRTKFKIIINFDDRDWIVFPKSNLSPSLKSELFSKSINYEFAIGKIKISYQGYEKLITDDSMFDFEDNVYCNGFIKIRLKDMDHQFLSNILQYAEIRITLYPEQYHTLEKQIEQIKTKIIPELEKRFNGKLLPYEPQAEWDKKLYQRYLNKISEDNSNAKTS